MNRKYKNGWKSTLPLCTDCGTRLSTRSAKICRKCYYKTLKGDGNPFYGKHHSEEWKIEIHKSRKSYKPTEETRKKVSEHNLLVGKVPPVHKGKDHWNWKGGIRPLEKRIREIQEYKIWRGSVFNRDEYTCQRCRVSGGKLRAHHKKRFHMILSEFLNKYNQFSIIDDVDILVRLSMSYSPFWDVNNGETVCHECHLKEHTNMASSP